jgi:hypothetical protein
VHWRATRDRLLAAWSGGSEEAGRFLDEQARLHGFEMWSRAARVVADSYREYRSPLQALTGLHPPAPTLHLFSQAPDPDFLERQLWFSRRQPWFEAESLGGRTHVPMLEAPARTAGKIEDFVASRALRSVYGRERRPWAEAMVERR